MKLNGRLYVGGSSLNQPNTPSETSQLPPQLVVEAARRARKNVEKNEEDRQAEKQVRVMAWKAVLAEHCNKISCGIQSFVKFFLGNPTKIQDYPPPPTPAELQALYWVAQRTEAIKNKLDQIRQVLANNTPAEIDFMVNQAEKEIRKKIKMPPFTPAIQKGDHKGQAVSTQTKADVERALALEGISRLTFNWEVKYRSESPWNSTVIKVLGSKAVEWLQRSVPISREEAGQAPAVIQQWVNTKCREIREAATLGGDNYDQIKAGKAAKAQFERWRKKVSQVSEQHMASLWLSWLFWYPSAEDQRQQVLNCWRGFEEQHSTGAHCWKQGMRIWYQGWRAQ